MDMATNEYSERRYAEAQTAYEPLSRNINGGHPNILGAVIAREHRYLTNELAQAVAYGVISGTYESACPVDSIFGAHPEHDGRLSCGTVVGAFATMGARPNSDLAVLLAERKFWLERIYEPGY
jgi:hypothetical protein